MVMIFMLTFPNGQFNIYNGYLDGFPVSRIYCTHVGQGPCSAATWSWGKLQVWEDGSVHSKMLRSSPELFPLEGRNNNLTLLSYTQICLQLQMSTRGRSTAHTLTSDVQVLRSRSGFW